MSRSPILPGTLSARALASPRAVGAQLALAATLTLAAPALAQTFVYVASQDAATVAVIDTETRALAATVDVRTLGYSASSRPHGTAVESDGSYWYVSLIGDGKVLKLDRENRLVGEAAFETPGLLALDPASSLLYVGRSMAAVNPPRRLGVIDRRTMEIEEIDVFVSRPHALVVDPVRSRFLTASMDENRIAYAPVGEEDVDLLTLEGPVHAIVQFAVSPDGHWMVGGGHVSGSLLVFDLTRPEPVLAHSIPLCGMPFDPVFTPDGAWLWIPCQSENRVAVLDTRTWTLDGFVEHPALAQPHGSAVSPDGATVYVSGRNLDGSYTGSGSDPRPGTVVAIDAVTRRVLRVLEIGRYAAGMSAPVAGPVAGPVPRVAPPPPPAPSR